MSNTRKPSLIQGLNGLASTVANPLLPVALEDGHFVSSRVVRLIEVIREKWPTLDVKWIPREMRSADDPAFLIVEKSQGQEFPVFHIKDESEFDGTVIERLIQSDSQYTNVHSDIEAHNEAIRLIASKIEDDMREERMEIIRYAIRSGKFNYTVPGKDGPIAIDTHGAKILRGEA